MTNPILGFLGTLLLFIRNRVIFDKSSINKTIEAPDGQSFSIFRRVIISVPVGTPDPEAYFLVRFKPKKVSVRSKKHIRLPSLLMMIFMGFKGFRSKYWAVNHQTGICQGLYEWQTVSDAENYSKSIAIRILTKKSYPESVSFRIIDRRKEKLEVRIVEKSNGVLHLP